MLLDLPTEIVQEIALYIASFPDLVAFSLTNKHVYNCLQTGVVHRQRIINAGWDVGVWDFEDPEERPGELHTLMQSSLQEYWQHSDLLHAQIESLLDTAAKDQNDYFFHPSARYPMDPRPALPALSLTDWGAPLLDYASEGSVLHKYDPEEWGLWEADIDGEDCRIIDGQKTLEWMVRAGEVLPMLLVQHREHNVQRLLQREYTTVWTISLRTLIGLAFSPQLTYGPRALEDDDGFWDLFHSNALERFSFSVFYLFLLGNPDSLTDPPIATLDYPAWFALIDRYFLRSSKDFISALFTRRVNQTLPELISRRFAVCFLIQTLILITVQCRHDFSSDSESTFEYLGLNAPSRDDMMKWGASALWSDSPEDLQHGIAGTPLAELVEMGPGTVMEWEGYYLNQDGPYWQEDPPASMTLFLVQPHGHNNPRPRNKASLYFNAVGHGSEDDQIRFGGRCDMSTGTVTMDRIREDGKDSFRGVVTPFGMSGRWDDADGGENGGWWFIWPKEISTDSDEDSGDGSEGGIATS